MKHQKRKKERKEISISANIYPREIKFLSIHIFLQTSLSARKLLRDTLVGGRISYVELLMVEMFSSESLEDSLQAGNDLARTTRLH